MNSFAVVLFFATAAAPHAGQHPVFPRRHLGGTYSQVAKLTAADAAAWGRFGSSVVIDGDTIVVGSNGDEGGGYMSGAAYVFRTSDGGATYGQVAKLTASDAASGDNFGNSVAIDGNTIVVGAYTKTMVYGQPKTYVHGVGAVYVFRTSDGGATYGQVAKLTASDIAWGDNDGWGDNFGNSMAIDGNTIVIGAYYDNINGGAGGYNYGQGSVYVFRTNDGGATYVEVAKLVASDATLRDMFGVSVAIYGATVVVGAHYDTDGGYESGSAYVFHTTDGGATYGQSAKLAAADASAEAFFGISVAIDGATIMVGASGDDSRRGAVYVFRTTDGGATYGQVAKLTASDAVAGDYFGFRVAIDGGTVVIGASGDNDDAGSVYVFRTSDGGATYDEVAKMTAADAASGNYFGRSVATAGQKFVVGALDDHAGEDSGSAYVFDANVPTSQPTTSQPTTSQPTVLPSPVPSLTPTSAPTTAVPTSTPTSHPTTAAPSLVPTPRPSMIPTLTPVPTQRGPTHAPTATPQASSSSGGDDAETPAIIAGAAAGVVLLFAVGAYCCYRRRQGPKADLERPEEPEGPTPAPSEEAIVLSIAPEAEPEAEQPPPPPATETNKMYYRIGDWYNKSPECGELRAAWGAYPKPEEFQAWPGFVQVTNAFLDREAGQPEAPRELAFEPEA